MKNKALAAPYLGVNLQIVPAVPGKFPAFDGILLRHHERQRRISLELADELCGERGVVRQGYGPRELKALFGHGPVEAAGIPDGCERRYPAWLKISLGAVLYPPEARRLDAHVENRKAVRQIPAEAVPVYDSGRDAP